MILQTDLRLTAERRSIVWQCVVFRFCFAFIFVFVFFVVVCVDLFLLLLLLLLLFLLLLLAKKNSLLRSLFSIAPSCP